MRFSFLSFLLSVSCVFAQPEIITITPDTVVAILNGQKFTAGDFERITQSLSPQLKSLAATNPKEFLAQYAEALALASEGEKAKLHETFPYRERIADARNQILAQAIMTRQTEAAAVTPEEARKHYEAHKDDFRHARAKVIFISRVAQISNLGDGKVKNVSPEEIKANVDKVTKLAKAGEDFVKLAKEYSDDRATAENGADLPSPIRANANNIPLDMRQALLAANAGDVVGPLEHQTGFYLFRVETVEIPPFEEVKDDVEKELKQAQVKRWLEDVKAKSSVKLENDAFWQTFAAANQPQKAQPEEVKPSPAPAATPAPKKDEPKPAAPAKK